jgi:hypothetical protein
VNHMQEIQSFYSDGQPRPITDGWVRLACQCGHEGETTTRTSRDGTQVLAECDGCGATHRATL